MEMVKADALMAVHRTMIVLREEIEMKNRIIMKLRKQLSRKKVYVMYVFCLLSTSKSCLNHKDIPNDTRYIEETSKPIPDNEKVDVSTTT